MEDTGTYGSPTPGCCWLRGVRLNRVSKADKPAEINKASRAARPSKWCKEIEADLALVTINLEALFFTQMVEGARGSSPGCQRFAVRLQRQRRPRRAEPGN